MPIGQIKHFEKLSISPAYTLALEGQNYIVQEGYTPVPGWIAISWDDQCIAYMEGGEALSVIVFNVVPHKNAWYITLGYTEPSSEGQGLYTQLYKHLRKMAMEAGVNRIIGETSVKNERMLKVHAKLHRKIVSYTFEDEIEDLKH